MPQAFEKTQARTYDLLPRHLQEPRPKPSSSLTAFLDEIQEGEHATSTALLLSLS